MEQHLVLARAGLGVLPRMGIINYIRAGYAGLTLVSAEEQRVELQLAAIAQIAFLIIQYRDHCQKPQRDARVFLLCYYLQEKGLLVKFYQQFVAGSEQDPTGYATLQRVLGEKDMDSFKKKWEKFVLGLRGP